MGSELLESENQNGVKINIRAVPEKLRFLIGKAVKIMKGHWKGYTGNLKSANEKMAKVELISRNKTINIPIDDICDFNKDLLTNDSSLFTPKTMLSMTNKTPAYYPQSPNLYGASPKWNPTTPGHFTASPYHTMASPNNCK